MDMPDKVELPAVQRGYDLAKELLPRVGRYPKEYRFTLGALPRPPVARQGWVEEEP
jgi:hypothetical protein